MTREEFINLEVGDIVRVSSNGADKGRLCEVTDIFPMWPELRERINGKVTARVLDGEFNAGDINPDGSKTLRYRGWNKVSKYVLKYIK